MTDQWRDILTADQLEAYHAATARLDPAFAAKAKRFYESRTLGQLRALEHQAWLTNSPDSYQLARSYAALKEAAR